MTICDVCKEMETGTSGKVTVETSSFMGLSRGVMVSKRLDVCATCRDILNEAVAAVAVADRETLVRLARGES